MEFIHQPKAWTKQKGWSFCNQQGTPSDWLLWSGTLIPSPVFELQLKRLIPPGLKPGNVWLKCVPLALLDLQRGDYRFWNMSISSLPIEVCVCMYVWRILSNSILLFSYLLLVNTFHIFLLYFIFSKLFFKNYGN